MSRNPLEAGATDDSHFLFYGHAAAADPPADPSQVFVLWDDFESGALDQWTSAGAPVWSVEDDEAHGGRFSLKAVSSPYWQPSWLAARDLEERNVVFDAYWRLSTLQMDLAQGVHAVPSQGALVEHVVDQLGGLG